MSVSRRAFLGGVAGLAASLRARPSRAAEVRFDVVVYGATPSGILAAYAAAREGASVALIFAGPFGGMVANGLGDTDVGRMSVLGGLCLEVFRRNGKRYGVETRRDFEPAVAKSVLYDMVREARIRCFRNSVVSAVDSLESRIDAIRLTTNEVIQGRSFVDASYEGDLMAAAGCRYRVGRESRSEFQESFAGFKAVEKFSEIPTADSAGRVFDLILPMPPDPRYGADWRVQAYGFRLCLSDDPANRVPFPRPANYDPDRFLLEINRVQRAVDRYPGFMPHRILDRKFDLNSHYLGRSYGWPDGTWAERAAIWDNHYSYHAGLLYTFANDPRVPGTLREMANTFGLAKDEFVDSGNWPRQLYVREARRLRGQYVMRQQDCQTDVTKAHSIGLGSYSFDSHGSGIYLVAPGVVNTEGSFGGKDFATVPYEIPYECLLPLEYTNVFVSVCASATQIAMCSMRMEPQYMIMGEAAGLAAAHVARKRLRAIDLQNDISDLLAKRGAKVHV